MNIETDRAEIVELFGRYADVADTKKFDELVPLVHTDPFVLDFGSVMGASPVESTLSDYVDALRASFAPFVATHHSITGHIVSIDGDHAHARAHVRAEHWVTDEVADGGPNRWLVVGFYDNEVVRTARGWRFSKVKLTAAYQENTHLLAAAAA